MRTKVKSNPVYKFFQYNIYSIILDEKLQRFMSMYDATLLSLTLKTILKNSLKTKRILINCKYSMKYDHIKFQCINVIK